MEVVIDIVVLMDCGLLNPVLLDSVGQLQLEVGVSQHNLELTQTFFEETEKIFYKMFYKINSTYKLIHEPDVMTRSSATRVPVQTNSPSLVRMAATQQ